MNYVALKMKPGLDVEQTALLNSAGWTAGAAVRFRDGLPEKTGGWARLNSETFIGICTGMHGWADLAGNLYISGGTDQRLWLFFGGLLIDITPIRATSNDTPDFSTTIGTGTVEIVDSANGSAVGDWVNIIVPVSVGGLIVQGFYQVTAIVDANTYQIEVGENATASVSNGGAVPLFTTTMGSPDIEVTLANHGLLVAGIFEVQVATTVGGVTIAAQNYSVVAPVTTNTFVIQPGGAAASSTTGSENGGNARIQYLIPTGLQSSAYSTSGAGGYGGGNYGAGPYGVSSSGTVLVALRQWFLDNFGQDLIGNYTNSPLIVWEPPYATGNVAKVLDTTNFPSAIDPPTQVAFSFVASQQSMVIAGGCNIRGSSTFDPMLVRWCDIRNFLDWAPLSTNQAGSYRIPKGSRLVGGIQAPNFTVLWTDIGMWLMTYLGGSGGDLSQLVWGFNEVAGGVGLLSARSCAVYRNLAFFASSNGVYVFNGNAITLIPCPVWDKFWKNLNRVQVDKVNMQVNSYFQEISIAFPSATGDGTVDSRITYNMREDNWTYDDAPTLLARTAWIDENVYGSPAGTDLSGYIQQQDSEGVYDADGVALPASIRTGWFSAQEGTLLTILERIEADMIVSGGTGTIKLTVFAQDYATGPERTYGPYVWVVGDGPPFSIVRARGRFLSIQISSDELGIFWRLGNIRYTALPGGRRP